MGMLQLSDLVAWPEGMNLQVKPWAIEPTQARYLQDILLDKEEVAYMRGPVRAGLTPTLPSIADKSIGIVATQDPQDVWRVGVLAGDAANSRLYALNTAFTSATSLTFDIGGTLFFDPAKTYRYSTAPHMKGGVIIGVQPWTAKKTQTGVAHWGGGAKAAVTGTDLTVTQNGTTVDATGTHNWDTLVEPGMFLYAVVDIATGQGKQYIGQVKSVTDQNTLVLVEGALFAVSGRNYTIRSIRPLDRRASAGRITCTSSSAVVDGTGTKFDKMNLGAGAWAIFRADDMKYVGKITSVATDTRLTLTANANATCNKDEFVAIDLSGDRSVNVTGVGDFGWIVAFHQGRQWYAASPYSNKNKPFNESRVTFSKYFDPEATDDTVDGDHIFIPNTKPPLRSITGMRSTPSCLLVTKETETWGIFGTSEADFAPRWLHNDGAFGPMVFQDWNGGVVWAGEKGIWFFDGNEVYPLIDDRAGDWYTKAVEKSGMQTYPAYSMIYKGNYFLYIPQADPPYGPDTTANDDNSSEGGSVDYLCLCVNLERRALSTITNLAFLGAVSSPLEEAQGTIYLVNHCNTTTPFAFNSTKLCRASDLFTDNLGPDTLNTQTRTARNNIGPSIFIESGRYDVGTPQVKKRFKQLMGNFWIQSVDGNYVALGNTGAGATDYSNNYLNLATMVGLNDVAVTSNGKWRLTRAKNASDTFVAAFQNRRVKFNKKSQFLGFKIWPSATNTGFQKIVFGAMALAYKDKRPGQV